MSTRSSALCPARPDFAIEVFFDGACLLCPREIVAKACTYTTAVAFDELVNLSALPLVDDYTGLAAGSIRVRATDAAPAVGQVDLWNVPESGEASALWTDVDFGAARSEPPLAMQLAPQAGQGMPQARVPSAHELTLPAPQSMLHP